MLHRLAYVSLIWLLFIVGCGSDNPTVAERSAAPAVSPSATPPVSPTTLPAPSITPAAQPSATIAETATLISPESWQTYTNAAGGYTLEIPAAWSVVGEPAASIMFFEQDADLNQLATGEPQFFAGGVEILGLISTEPDPYLAVLPNHSAITAMQEIETPLGAGRVYTLRRDRFQPSGSDTVWYAQQAMIPVGSRIVAVWTQVESTTGGALRPELERMISSLQLN